MPDHGDRPTIRSGQARAAGALAVALWACIAVLTAAPPTAAVVAPVAPAPLAPAPVAPAPIAPALIAPARAWSAIVPGAVNRTSIDVEATYAVDARLAVALRSLRGSVTITARNRSGSGIDRLELNTVMGPLGALHLGAVTVDGTARSATLSGQTITVPLGGILPAGATATVVVPFQATLRAGTSGSTWLFTGAGGVVSLYRWVPWISRATPFDRPNHGDPFVTPASPRVTLRLATDVPLVVEANGTRTSRSTDGLVTTWSALNVRDLVVSAAAGFRTRAAVVGDTVIRVATLPGAPAATIMAAATTALQRLEARLGPYPWPVLRIIGTSGGYGMEGPGIVWIPADAPAANLPYLVTHEIAHQWFYGLVGNDQAREPFADEAMTDMVARFVLGLRRASRCAAAPLDRPIYRYSAGCYYETVYIRGGNLLDDARRAMGTTTFFTAIRGYLGAHRWGIVHTRTLLDAIDAATPLDLMARWRASFPTLY